MKRIIFLVIITILVFSSCREDINETNTEIITTNPEINVVTRLIGKVIDEGGDPVSGVQVQAGAMSTSTDVEGGFTIESVVLRQGSGQVVARKNGYFEQVSKVSSQADQTAYQVITILNRGTAQTLNSSTGGTLNMGDGLTVEFPSNSLRFPNGTPYTGTANVYARYLNPTDEEFSNRLPADLVGIDKDGNTKALKTFAVFHLSIESASGGELEVDPNAGVEVVFPIDPALEASVPDPVPLWEYDLEEEFWLQDVDCYPVSGGNYQCTVGGSGTYCCCMPLDGITLGMTVYNEDGTPAEFVKVELDDANSYFVFGGYTTNTGFIRGVIPENAAFTLMISDLCGNIVYTDNIGPYTESTTLGDINLPVNVEQFSINIQGVMIDCTSPPTVDGWINVRYPSYEKAFPILQDGSFDEDIFFNCIDFPDVELIAYSFQSVSQTDPVYHNQLSDWNAGNMVACMTLTSELFIDANGTMVKMYPAHYKEVWSEPLDTEIISEIPGGTTNIRILNYSGTPGTYSGEIEIIDIPTALPDYSNVEGQSISATINITSDNGETLEGNINATLQNGATNFNATIDVLARKKL